MAVSAVKEWMSTKEVCARLEEAGLSITPRSLRGWRQQEDNPLVWRLHGRDWRISGESLERYIRLGGQNE